MGMKQRLGLALAMLGSPDVLLLDEPMNGLDPEGVREMRNLIIRLNEQRGVTVGGELACAGPAGAHRHALRRDRRGSDGMRDDGGRSDPGVRRLPGRAHG